MIQYSCQIYACDNQVRTPREERRRGKVNHIFYDKLSKRYCNVDKTSEIWSFSLKSCIPDKVNLVQDARIVLSGSFSQQVRWFI